MTALGVLEATAYGKSTNGRDRWNVTSYVPLFTAPPGGSTLAKPPGSPVRGAAAITRSMLATTSSAVSAPPSENVTPCRMRNVHREASAFGCQLVASTGLRV